MANHSAPSSATEVEVQPAAAPSGGTNGAAGTERGSEFEILKTQLQAVETARAQLLTRQRESQLFQKEPPGYAQVFAPATTKTVVVRDRRPKIILLALFGGMMGVVGSALLLL